MSDSYLVILHRVARELGNLMNRNSGGQLRLLLCLLVPQVVLLVSAPMESIDD
jgi:hypothetical protein